MRLRTSWRFHPCFSFVARGTRVALKAVNPDVPGPGSCPEGHGSRPTPRGKRSPVGCSWRGRREDHGGIMRVQLLGASLLAVLSVGCGGGSGGYGGGSSTPTTPSTGGGTSNAITITITGQKGDQSF